MFLLLLFLLCFLVVFFCMQARDEKGRKRLHGAFTGGFSAGYFNTVGSKEGEWIRRRRKRKKCEGEDEEIRMNELRLTS